MADQDLVIKSLASGRNGVDFPASDDFPPDQSVEALNVDYRNGGLGRRRGGVLDVLANTTNAGSLTAFKTLAMDRVTLTGDETAWQLWAFGGSSAQSFLVPGTAWSTGPTGPATFASDTAERKTHLLSFNGRLQAFYEEFGAPPARDRHHIFDPTQGAFGSFRYTGFDVPAAPTVVNQGAGAYPATLRYYRIRWLTINGPLIVRRSEPGPSTAFTPSGAGASAQINRPALPLFDVSPTHWEVEASPDNTYFYGLYSAMPLGTSPPAVGTLNVLDTLAVGTYQTNFSLSRPVGTYVNIPAARFGITDGNRVVFCNQFVAGKGSRVGWTPILGSLDEGDDERLFQTATVKPYLDLDEKNGGDLLGGSQINGVIYLFKMRQVWRLTPTTDLIAPFIARRLSSTVGAMNFRSVNIGEDASGNPCIYFMSHKGPYRVGPNGLEYLGRDIEDITRTLAGSPNINTTATVISHSVFHGDMGQWWVWVATGNNTLPNELLVFDIKRGVRKDQFGVRGGWTRFNGPIAGATCSCMGPATFAASVVTRPWIATDVVGKIGIADRDDVTTDMGTTWVAQVKTRSVARFGKLLRIGEVVGIVRHGITGVGVNLTLTVDRDFGAQTVSTTKLSDTTTDRYLQIKWDGAGQMADAMALQIQIAEAAASAGYWELVELKLPIFYEGDV